MPRHRTVPTTPAPCHTTQIEDYLPAEAPQRLLPPDALACGAKGCGAAAPPAGVASLSALEAVLLTALLTALLAWLASLLALRRQAADAAEGAAPDPAAPLLLGDTPCFPGRAGPAWPACSNSPGATSVEAFLRFARLPYGKAQARCWAAGQGLPARLPKHPPHPAAPSTHLLSAGLPRRGRLPARADALPAARAAARARRRGHRAPPALVRARAGRARGAAGARRRGSRAGG